MMSQATTVPAAVNIAIVGGGLGGLALAVGLARAKISFHIFEAAPSFSEIGAGITLGPNAERAIALIAPELLAGLRKHATQNASPELKNSFCVLRHAQHSRRNGKEAGSAFGAINDDHDYGHDDGTQISLGSRSCVHRARLLDELTALLPFNVTSFGMRLVSIEEDEQTHRPLLRFENGRLVQANAVVGADGIKSRVRSWVFPKNAAEPAYAGEYVYRALVPKATAISVLGEERTMNAQVYCAYGGYIVTYPIEHHELLNIVAIRRKPGSEWPHEEWQIPTRRAELLEDWKGCVEDVVGLLEQYSTTQWALYHHLHDHKYNRARVVLLGDSAHSSTPHCGAAGGMAMEDAYILSHLLAEYPDEQHIEKVFEAYDRARRPRTQGLVKRSDEAGSLLAFLTDGVEDDEMKVQAGWLAIFKWVWHVDLKAELQSANDHVRELIELGKSQMNGKAEL